MLFTRILIANRGEIAVRIARACRKLGVEPVAVYSDADANALHVRMAGKAVEIGPAPARDSYLNIERIIDAARASRCEAIHPGYGFLSENPDFADAVQAAGLVFIGPPAAAIRAMGIKTAALALMRAANVPTVPGYQDGEDFAGAASQIGYPVLIKAAAGGGGKGMRIVRTPSDLAEAVAAAQRESQNAFGDERVFLEKYIESAHHVEFQILADSDGHTVYLFDRECSIQRRHQKIIEESPSPLLDAGLRQRMGTTAVAAAKAVSYVNAGTIEFIVDADHNFYFLEMNTRLQVEHPVTEWVTGLDLVAEQIKIAAGEALPFTQSDLVQRGHAIECRIYAEDPANDFYPSIGTISRLVEPSGPGVRIDAGAASGDEISIHYDPLIAKLSVYGAERTESIARLRQALAEYRIDGLTTNLAFLRAVIAHPAFIAGQTTTSFITDHLADWAPPPEPESTTASQPIADPPLETRSPWERADGFRLGGGVRYAIQASNTVVENRTVRHAEGTLMAAMPGQVTRVLVAPGDSVARGQTLATLEAMKMELRLTAPRDGQVRAVRCEPGQVVARGQVLIELE